MDTHEVLVKARNNLDREGWQQGMTYRPGPNCALGHLRFASGLVISVTRTSAYDALRKAMGPDCLSVGMWNDAPGRTKAEVLEAFDRAIAATAPEPNPGFMVAEPELVA